MSPSSARILIADGDRFARIGLRTVLTARAEWSVCAEAATGDEAVVRGRAMRPDVALLGANLHGPGCLGIARALRTETPSPGIVIVASRASPELLHHAARAGARALVLRSDSEATLVRAVERVCRGQRHMPVRADDRPREPARDPLSPRELEVAALIASGRSTKETARILGVTSKTGDTYRTRLMRKIGAHSVVDVVFFAIRHGLIDID